MNLFASSDFKAFLKMVKISLGPLCKSLIELDPIYYEILVMFSQRAYLYLDSVSIFLLGSERAPMHP